MEGRQHGAWFRPPAVATYTGDGRSGIGTGGMYPPAVHRLTPNFNLQPPNFYHLLQNPAQIPVLSPRYPNPFVETSNFPMHHQNLKFPPRQIPNFSSQNPSSSAQNASVVPRAVGNKSGKVKGKSSSFPAPQSDKSGRENDGAHSEIKSERKVIPKKKSSKAKRGVRKKISDKRKQEEILGRIEDAVSEVRKAMVASGESVCSFEVSQAVISKMEADSWQSLGFQMHDVPSLQKLMKLEGKINAFIHCFIGVRNIATLFDLEVAICKTEGINHFDDLELGPLLQHPLVLLCFPSNTGVTKPFKITCDDIISFLEHFLDDSTQTDVKIDEFLSFIAKEKSLAGKEKLGVRIQDLGMYISFIRDAKRREDESTKNFLNELPKKYGNFSSSKEQQDDLTLAVSEPLKSFPCVHKDFRGEHTRFGTLSSDNEDIKEKNIDKDTKNADISNHVSSCPFPSVTEEMKRLESSSKTQKSENLRPAASKSSKTRKRKRERQEKLKLEKANGVSRFGDADKKLIAPKISSVGDEGPKIPLATEQLGLQVPRKAKNVKLGPGYDNSVSESQIRQNQFNLASRTSQVNAEAGINPYPRNLLSVSHEFGVSNLTDRDQFHAGTPWATQALQTGRKGEQIAFKYFADKCSRSLVKWVNEYNETGFPYDIIIEDGDGKKQYIEVKATISAKKDWFNISVGEWRFACEKGEAFSVAHVLLGNNDAILTQHSNPVKLCQEGRLRLVMVMPNQQNEFKSFS